MHRNALPVRRGIGWAGLLGALAAICLGHAPAAAAGPTFPEQQPWQGEASYSSQAPLNATAAAPQSSAWKQADAPSATTLPKPPAAANLVPVPPAESESVAVPVPEPDVIALVAAGVLGFLATARPDRWRLRRAAWRRG